MEAINQNESHKKRIYLLSQKLTEVPEDTAVQDPLEETCEYILALTCLGSRLTAPSPLRLGVLA